MVEAIILYGQRWVRWIRVEYSLPITLPETVQYDGWMFLRDATY